MPGSHINLSRSVSYSKFNEMLKSVDGEKITWKDNSIQVDGKLAYLNKKGKVVLGEKKVSRWKRTIHKVLQILRKRPREMSAVDYWHEKYNDSSKVLKERIMTSSGCELAHFTSKPERSAELAQLTSESERSTELTQLTSTEHAPAPGRGCIKYPVPQEVSENGEEKARSITVMYDDNPHRVFDSPDSMKKYLLDFSNDFIKLSPSNQSQVAHGLQKHFLASLDEGLGALLKGECSWEQMLEQIGRSQQMFIDEALRHNYLDGTNKQISDTQLAAQLHHASGALLSLVNCEAGKVCYLSSSENPVSVFTPRVLESKEKLSFSISADEQPSLYAEGVATPVPYSNTRKEGELPPGWDQSDDSSHGMESVTSAAERTFYNQSGASKLSLHGLFYQPGGDISSQLQADRGDGKKLLVFNNKEELEKQIDEVLDRKHASDEKTRPLSRQFLANELASEVMQMPEKIINAAGDAVNEGYLSPETVPVFADYLKQASIKPLSMNSNINVANSLRFKEARRLMAEDLKAQLIVADERAGVLRGKLIEASYSKLHDRKLMLEKLNHSLAYLDIKKPADTTQPVAMLSPEDCLVLLDPVGEDELITISAPLPATAQAPSADEFIGAVGRQSCELKEPFNPESCHIYRSHGDSEVRVFDEKSKAFNYLDAEKETLNIAMESQKKMLAELRQAAPATEIELLEEVNKLRNLKQRASNLESTVAWVDVLDQKHIIFASPLEQGEPTVKLFESDIDVDEPITLPDYQKVDTDEILFSKADESMEELVPLRRPHVIDEKYISEPVSFENKMTFEIPGHSAVNRTKEKEIIRHEPRIQYLFKSFVPRVSGKDIGQLTDSDCNLSDKPHTARLLRALKRCNDDGMFHKDLENMIACAELYESTIMMEDHQALKIPFKTYLIALGIPPEKVSAIKRFGDDVSADICAELCRLEEKSIVNNKLRLHKIIRHFSSIENHKNKVKLLKKVNQHRKEHKLPSFGSLEVMSAKVLNDCFIGYYLDGILSQSELASVRLTMENVRSYLGVNIYDTAEAQFQTLFQQAVYGDLTESFFAELSRSFHGGDIMYQHLQLVQILEPGKLVPLPPGTEKDSFEAPNKLVTRKALLRCMRRYFGTPLPATRAEAFRRIYSGVYPEKIAPFSLDACERALEQIAGKEKVDKIKALAAIKGQEQIAELVGEGKLDHAADIDNMLINMLADDKTDLKMLMALDIPLGKILDGISFTRYKSLRGNGEITRQLLKKSGLVKNPHEVTYRNMHHRRQLLQKKANATEYAQWEEQRLLSDDFVKSKLMELSKVDLVSSGQLNTVGIQFSESVAEISPEQIAREVLQGGIPVDKVPPGLLNGINYWNILGVKEVPDTDQLKAAMLIDIIKEDQTQPGKKASVVYQTIPLLVENIMSMLLGAICSPETIPNLPKEKEKEALCLLYAAGMIDAESMYITGFYDHELQEIKEKIKLPVSLSGLDTNIANILRKIIAVKPALKEKIMWDPLEELAFKSNQKGEASEIGVINFGFPGSGDNLAEAIAETPDNPALQERVMWEPLEELVSESNQKGEASEIGGIDFGFPGSGDNLTEAIAETPDNPALQDKIMRDPLEELVSESDQKEEASDIGVANFDFPGSGDNLTEAIAETPDNPALQEKIMRDPLEKLVLESNQKGEKLEIEETNFDFPGSEDNLTEAIAETPDMKNEMVTQDQVTFMKDIGFSVNHLNYADFRENMALLYIGGVLSKEQLASLNFGESVIEGFNNWYKAPVQVSVLDSQIRADLAAWMGNNISSKNIDAVINNFIEDDVAVASDKISIVETARRFLKTPDAGREKKLRKVARKIVTEEAKHVSDKKTDKVPADDKTVAPSATEVNEEIAADDISEDTRYGEIMAFSSFSFLVHGKKIRFYYEKELDTHNFEAVKAQMAEDIISGKLKSILTRDEPLIVDMGGVEYTIEVSELDLGPLYQFIK